MEKENRERPGINRRSVLKTIPATAAMGLVGQAAANSDRSVKVSSGELIHPVNVFVDPKICKKGTLSDINKKLIEDSESGDAFTLGQVRLLNRANPSSRNKFVKVQGNYKEFTTEKQGLEESNKPTIRINRNSEAENTRDVSKGSNNYDTVLSNLCEIAITNSEREVKFEKEFNVPEFMDLFPKISKEIGLKPKEYDFTDLDIQYEISEGTIDNVVYDGKKFETELITTTQQEPRYEYQLTEFASSKQKVEDSIEDSKTVQTEWDSIPDQLKSVFNSASQSVYRTYDASELDDIYDIIDSSTQKSAGTKEKQVKTGDDYYTVTIQRSQ
ncbi:hypothetical protein EGH22_20620 [Halomicroarcula sp. F28]|uniref:hypothetical protein n=1 Tax=Haloarcula salinisoli TaxID=2487746 RepID=UPI001C72B063|nr:hypothetical protein [Halomicroarcula salinisoli]MBX0288738.1 hypothetical protein [Halomicroarcula salinisoli]